MDFDYVKDQYDELTAQLLDSTFVINATIHIKSIDIGHDSTYSGMSDSLDARHTEAVQSNYPKDLPRVFRVQVFPMERNYVRKQGQPTIHTFAGQFEPFDKWVSCLESAVAIRRDETYYTYADYVIIEGIRYKVKAIHKESFGVKPLIHAFLVKETDL